MGALAWVLALLLGHLGGHVARELTTAQEEVLALADRSTFVRVKIEDGDGTMVDVTDWQGYDWLTSARIRASVDEPIGSARIRLQREIDPGGNEKLSIAPLIEASALNLNAAGSYDPFVGLARFVEIDVAVMEPGHVPVSGDYEPLWEGYIDDVEWGGIPSVVEIYCRDPVSRLNDTIIETVRTYGGGSPLEPIEDVMQQILDDNMGSGEFPLMVIGDPDFGIEEYELAHASVLEALKALADLIGWNLHWRYHESPGEFRLTFYEPIRDRQDLSGFTPDWTFGPDDYYDLPGVRLALGGVRTAGEVAYLDADGAPQTVTEERSGSTAAYFRRFIRFDETPNRSIQTAGQASGLLSGVLDDLSVPPLLQSMDCAFHWPVELCDVHNFTTNAVHYDTTQTLAVFGFEHVLEQNRIRTFFDSSGQPSGGFRRWLAKERKPVRLSIIHKNLTDRTIAGDEMVGLEDTLQEIVIPSGRLTLTNELQASFHLTGIALVDTAAVIRLRLNGTEIIAISMISSDTDYDVDLELVNDGSLDAQVAVVSVIKSTVSDTFTQQARAALIEDAAADLSLEITIDWQSTSASDTVTLDYSLARLEARG